MNPTTIAYLIRLGWDFYKGQSDFIYNMHTCVVENLEGELGIGVPLAYLDIVDANEELMELGTNVVHTATGAFVDDDADGILDMDPDYTEQFISFNEIKHFLDEQSEDGEEGTEITVQDLIDEYYETQIEQTSSEELELALYKPFDSYTVEEALLVFIAGFSVLGVMLKMFKRRYY